MEEWRKIDWMYSINRQGDVRITATGYIKARRGYTVRLHDKKQRISINTLLKQVGFEPLCRKGNHEVTQYTTYGKIVNRFKSLEECKNAGFDLSAVCNSASGRISTHRGFVFRYDDDAFDKFPVKIKHTNKAKQLTIYFPAKRYTKEEVSKIAQKYTRMIDFAKGIDKNHYAVAYRHGWLDDICKHMEPRADIFRRDIYVYDIYYQGEKYAYVGLTYNVEHRHKCHLNDNRDAIFKFKEKTGCEIPYPEILYRNLDVDSASKKEDELIQEYKSRGYIMLNRVKGGSLGGFQGHSYSWEECKIIGGKYKTLKSWRDNEPKSYEFARYHFHDELKYFGNELRKKWINPLNKRIKISNDELANLARQYKKSTHFTREHPSLADELRKRGLDEAVWGVKPNYEEYNIEDVKNMIKGCQTVSDIKKRFPWLCDWLHRHGYKQKEVFDEIALYRFSTKKIDLYQNDEYIHTAYSITDLARYIQHNIAPKRTISGISSTIQKHLYKGTLGGDWMSKMGYSAKYH